MTPSSQSQPAMLCARCRYNLKGLRARCCPECGTAFDPDNPSTFNAGVDRRRMILSRAILLAFLALLMWLLFEVQRMPYRPPQDMSTFLGGGEIVFVRTLIAAVGAAWLVCAVCLAVTVLRSLKERRELQP